MARQTLAGALAGEFVNDGKMFHKRENAKEALDK
jgi:hypothetical protein